jgi:hypothetical protein
MSDKIMSKPLSRQGQENYERIFRRIPVRRSILHTCGVCKADFVKDIDDDATVCSVCMGDFDSATGLQ